MQGIPASARLLSRQIRCGKPTCRRCADGIGHGPYWYACWREGGNVRQRYLGKVAPGSLTMSTPEEASDTPPSPSSSERQTRAQPSRIAELSTPQPLPGVHLRIWLLGGLQVERDGVPVPRAAWRRSAVRSLLGMLLIADRQQLMREVIADRLFPDTPASVANSRLGELLHRLRRLLEPELCNRQPSRYLLQDGALVRFCLSEDTWVDYLAFTQALAACDEANAPIEQLHQAIACYGGDLLPAEQGDWCTPAREGGRLHWHGLLRRYGLAQSRNGRMGGAIETFRRLFDANPCDDLALPMIVRLLLKEQRRSDAMRYFRYAQRTFRKEEDPYNPALLHAASLLQIEVARGPA